MRGIFASIRARARAVIAISAGAALLAFGIASIVPRWYTATTVLMPPEESDLMSNITMAQRALTKFPAFGILTDYSTPADIYKAILNSRTVQEDLARQFDLKTVYRQKSLEKTLLALRAHTKIKLNPDGTIKVSVEDRVPARAAEMANAYVAALDLFNVEKRNTSARRTRQFLQLRVAETDSLMRRSEMALRKYQEKKHTVAPTAVGSSDVQGASDLMSRKIMLEVKLGVLRSYLNEDNDQVVQTRSELEQLERRIAALPELQGDLQRLIRDTKVYEQLYLLLTAELEQARVRETMDTPTVQVLDPAVTPERHSRPKRAILGLAAGMLAFCAASWWAAAADRVPSPRE